MISKQFWRDLPKFSSNTSPLDFRQGRQCSAFMYPVDSKDEGGSKRTKERTDSTSRQQREKGRNRKRTTERTYSTVHSCTQNTQTVPECGTMRTLQIAVSLSDHTKRSVGLHKCNEPIRFSAAVIYCEGRRLPRDLPPPRIINLSTWQNFLTRHKRKKQAITHPPDLPILGGPSKKTWCAAFKLMFPNGFLKKSKVSPTSQYILQSESKAPHNQPCNQPRDWLCNQARIWVCNQFCNRLCSQQHNR